MIWLSVLRVRSRQEEAVESESHREGSLETSSDYRGEAIEDKGGFSASRTRDT